MVSEMRWVVEAQLCRRMDFSWRPRCRIRVRRGRGERAEVRLRILWLFFNIVGASNEKGVDGLGKRDVMSPESKKNRGVSQTEEYERGL